MKFWYDSSGRSNASNRRIAKRESPAMTLKVMVDRSQNQDIHVLRNITSCHDTATLVSYNFEISSHSTNMRSVRLTVVGQSNEHFVAEHQHHLAYLLRPAIARAAMQGANRGQ
jgi:hypothetical protein